MLAFEGPDEQERRLITSASSVVISSLLRMVATFLSSAALAGIAQQIRSSPDQTIAGVLVTVVAVCAGAFLVNMRPLPRFVWLYPGAVEVSFCGVRWRLSTGYSVVSLPSIFSPRAEVRIDNPVWGCQKISTLSHYLSGVAYWTSKGPHDTPTRDSLNTVVGRSRILQRSRWGLIVATVFFGTVYVAAGVTSGLVDARHLQLPVLCAWFIPLLVMVSSCVYQARFLTLRDIAGNSIVLVSLLGRRVSVSTKDFIQAGNCAEFPETHPVFKSSLWRWPSLCLQNTRANERIRIALVSRADCEALRSVLKQHSEEGLRDGGGPEKRAGAETSP